MGSLNFLGKKFLHIAWKVWWACENVVRGVSMNDALVLQEGLNW